jgi:DNA modification methylase
MFENQIIQGDAFVTLKQFPDNSIDMILTSPPYDDLRDYNKFTFNFEGIAKELYRVLKDGHVLVWIVGDRTNDGDESGTSFKQALYFKEVGFKLNDTMIYKKNGVSNPADSWKRYNQIFEYMFILTKGKLITWNPLKDKPNKHYGRELDITKRKNNGKTFIDPKISIGSHSLRTNIWEYNTGYNRSTIDKIAYEHPAIFPEKLAEDHIKSWSNENDIILDPFMGSGTTVKMALKNNRKFIGIELNPEYIKIADKRLKPYLNQTRLI